MNGTGSQEYVVARLPDGTLVRVPTGLSDEEKRRLAEAVMQRFGTLSPLEPAISESTPLEPTQTPGTPSQLAGFPISGEADESMWAGWDPDEPIASLFAPSRPLDAGYMGKEGTLGSLWEGIKAIPRGAELAWIMSQQGIASLGTVDVDTEREKELRRRAIALYEKTDPRHLSTIGMALGQMGAFAAGSLAATGIASLAGAPLSLAGAIGLGTAGALGLPMGIGEATEKVADYEKRTGRDVSAKNEILAMIGGGALGLTEAVPMIRFGGRFARMVPGATGRMMRQTAREKGAEVVAERGAVGAARRIAAAGGDAAYSALAQGSWEALQEGSQGFGQSWLAKELYDDDALIGAGTEALREAIVGGEAGAVADVLLTMASQFATPGRWRGRSIAALNKVVGELQTSGELDDAKVAGFVTSEDPEAVELQNMILDGGFMTEALEQSYAAQARIRANKALTEPEQDQLLAKELQEIRNVVRPFIEIRAGISGYRDGTLATQKRAGKAMATEEADLGRRIVEITGAAEANQITPEQASLVASSSVSGSPAMDIYSSANTLSYIHRVLRQGVAESDALAKSNESPLDVAERLVTPEQRNNLKNLFESVQADDVLVTPAQARDLVNGILGDGVLLGNQVKGAITPEGLKIVSPAGESATGAQRREGKRMTNDVLGAVIGYNALSDTGIAIDEMKGKQQTDPGFEALAPFISDLATFDIVQELIGNDLKVSVDLARKALKAREIDQDLKPYTANVLEMREGDLTGNWWQKLLLSERQAVMSHILRTDIQRIQGARHSGVSPVSPSAGQRILSSLATKTSRRPRKYVSFAIGTPNSRSKAVTELTRQVNDAEGTNLSVENVVDYMERAVDLGILKDIKTKKTKLRTRVQFLTPTEAAKNKPKLTRRTEELLQIKRNLSREGVSRSDQQLDQDANALLNSKERLRLFRTILTDYYKKQGRGDIPIKLAVAADSIYAQIKGIYNDPNVIVDEKMYAAGPAASIQNHGTMLVFNISQLESQHEKGMETPITELVKDIRFHEGAHFYYLKDELRTDEQNNLKRLSKSMRVPKEFDQEAFDNEFTWYRWVESIYPNKSEGFLVEEASVRVLDALAQGKIPKAKAAGFLGKIKRDLKLRAEAIFSAFKRSDLLPVIRIFEKIQGGELQRRKLALAQEIKGAASARLLELATPEQLKALKAAARRGDKLGKEELEKVAREVALSKIASVEKVSLQQSLLNDLRARREIRDTPDAVLPLLNRDAIEGGLISPEALNAAFEFIDGNDRPFRMASQTRELRWGINSYIPSAEEQQILDDNKGMISDPTSEQVLTAFADHIRMEDGSHVITIDDQRKAMNYTAWEIAETDIFDSRIPVENLEKLAGQYGAREESGLQSALFGVAELSAVEAQRQSDASSYLKGALYEDGPVSLVDGAPIVVDVYHEGEKVKSQEKILLPMWKFGEAGERMSLIYMNSKRVASIAEAADAADVALIDAQNAGADEKTIDALRMHLWMTTDNLRRAAAEPVDEKGTLLSLEKAMSNIKDIEAMDTRMSRAVIKMGEELVGFNHYIIKFAYDNGQISRERMEYLQSMRHVPFYRDQGWKNAVPMYNLFNKNKRTKHEKGLIEQMGSGVVERDEDGLPISTILDQPIEESTKPFKNNFSQNIISNPGALVRDSLRNKALGMIARDTMYTNTAVEIPTVPDSEIYDARGYRAMLTDMTTGSKDAREAAMKKFRMNEAGVKRMKKQLAALDKKKRAVDKKAEKINKRLNDQNFSDVVMVVKGTHPPFTQVNYELVKLRLSQELGRSPTDEEIHAAVPLEGEIQDTEKAKASVVGHGETHTYRLMDPLLAVSSMSMGFSPTAQVEQMFQSAFAFTHNPWIGRKIAQLVTGASTLFRETIVRMPDFWVKNPTRDSMIVAQQRGGFFPMWMFRAFKKVFEKDLVGKGRRRGLAMPPYAVADARSAVEESRAVDKLRKRSLRKWYNPLDWFSYAWGAMGQLAQRSELSVRMVVSDKILEQGGSMAKSVRGGREILNYSRKGLNPLIRMYSAVSPFVSGNLQGASVIYRTGVGRLDSPAVYPDSKLDKNSAEAKALRITIGVGRGMQIAAATAIYYMWVRDKEWYKNGTENLKNNWWLFPIGGRTWNEGSEWAELRRIGYEENEILAPKNPFPGIRVSIPFELGLLYKIIPEQLLRAMTEEEHDYRDVGKAVWDNITRTLGVFNWPQIMRPMMSVLANEDSFTGRDIIPRWKNDMILPSEQFDEHTPEVAKMISNAIDRIPVLRHIPFLTSAMKLEFLVRGYLGTLGTLVMTLSDFLVSSFMDESSVGTRADIGLDRRTLANFPFLSGLLHDPSMGGGYQEQFYDMLGDLSEIEATIREIRVEQEDPQKASEMEQEFDTLLKHSERLHRMESEMEAWRGREDRVLKLPKEVMSDEIKRQTLLIMRDSRDAILAQILEIMAEIREDKGLRRLLPGLEGEYPRERSR